MLPHPLIALLLVITPTYATAGSGSDSFLSDTTLVRKDQVQNVLEHEPAQVADCRKVVSASHISRDGGLNGMAAYGSHRNDQVRLRNYRKRER